MIYAIWSRTYSIYHTRTSSTAFIALGWCESYGQFVNTFVRNIPHEKRVEVYATQYESFKKLHPALQSVYM
ncbi:hypothetical protein [Oceanobacillus sp. J11TS1]|uniref:hypothetical protein n=1 Tax=Oceanobacillus sp. J11TS1 TaxID=2807191 RepID=UPI001B2A9E63|nr:hypothetical protein [Oceanobacillus sp. J11TS1]GIO23465.1 hypothetical protein J11TS1_20460 [Oceanobacillus sp. J11TS1]